MIFDADSLTFMDNTQVFATPADGSGDIQAPTFSDSPAPTLPDSSTTQQAAATTTDAPPKLRIFRFAAPTGPANDVGTPSSGLAIYNPATAAPTGVSAVIAAVTAPITSPTPTTTTGPTGGITTGPSGVITGADDSINRLIDLMAAQFTAAHVNGGGSGFGGLVSGPLAGSDFVGGDTSAPAPTSHKGLIILALAVAGIGYWYYRSHKKRAA